MLNMKTFSTKPSDIKRDWYVVDATNLPMGRLASAVAAILRGKNKPYFVPHMDCGDFVIIINADKIRLTGNKGKEQVYHHTLWPGGIKSISRAKEIEVKPEKAFMRVVKGMLPHNKIGADMLCKLKVYAGDAHPHQAQQPKVLELVK